jgi:hypothetical protein
MPETFKVMICNDGACEVHDQGEVIATATTADKAQRVAAALNANTTFIPENKLGVKPGYCTRPDIVRLLRMHRMYPERIEFIANMMEG